MDTRYEFTNQQLSTRDGQVYALGEWAVPVDGLEPTASAEACGPGSLHLMKMVRPRYAPTPYRCFEAEGDGLLAEDDEKARYRRVRLIRELAPLEIDQGIDLDWAGRPGKSDLYMPIAWARTAHFLDRPVDKATMEPHLVSLARLLLRPTSVQWVTPDELRDELWASLWNSMGASLWASMGASLWASMGASMGASLWDSLGASLWTSLWASLWDSLGASLRDSLFYERGYALLGKPQLEIGGLLAVWRAGVCPVGFTKDKFVVMGPA